MRKTDVGAWVSHMVLWVVVLGTSRIWVSHVVLELCIVGVAALHTDASVSDDT